VGIIEGEGVKDLPGEGEVARGKAASATGALSEEDCEFELSWDLAGEEATVNGESVLRTSISNGGGRSVLKGSLDVGSKELEIVVVSHCRGVDLLARLENRVLNGKLFSTNRTSQDKYTFAEIGSKH